MIMKLQCAHLPFVSLPFANTGPDSRTLDYLFFGTITYVEEAIRNLLEAAQWTRNPIRFLVLDFSLVPGVDLSASEALVRIQHLLVSKHVTLVLCGFAMESSIALAFQSVELFEGQNVEVFLDINQAIEWTENLYLNAWFDTVKEAEPEAKAISEFTNTLLLSIGIEEVFCACSFPWATEIHSDTQRFISGYVAPKKAHPQRRWSHNASPRRSSSIPTPFTILFSLLPPSRHRSATTNPRGAHTDIDEDVLWL